MRSVIRDARVRTRALYAWERDELMVTKRNPRFDLIDVQKFTLEFWRREGRSGERVPPVEFLRDGDASYVVGGKIYLHMDDTGPVILTHELVHRLGYGVGRSIHNVAFTREYIRCLSIYVGYERDWLTFSAMARRLI